MVREHVFAQFDARSGEKRPAIPFVPDLRIWHSWHSKKGTIPKEYSGATHAEVCGAIGVSAFDVVRPWRIETDGAVDRIEMNDSKRVWTLGVGSDVLTARWTIGPDGDFWQTEYPVKSSNDLEILGEYLKRRTYDVMPEVLGQAIGEDRVTVVELPSRPFAWLMLEVLGWSDGLMLLLDDSGKIETLLGIAEEQVAEAERAVIAALSPDRHLLMSPDNLDAQFVSPTFFDCYLATSYRRISNLVHRNSGSLLVHSGGPIASLLPSLAECEVDSVVGASGPPQGDTDLQTASELTDGRIVPWGGIPQDLLMPSTEEARFTEEIERITEEARVGPPAVLAVADHVPIEADISRLIRIQEMR